MRAQLTKALIVLALAGCRVPPVEVSDPAASEREGARETVREALESLKAGNEEQFKLLLSEERQAEYTNKYFAMWVSELEPVENYEIQGIDVERHPFDVRARLSLTIGGVRQVTSVRLRYENGRWRWNER